MGIFLSHKGLMPVDYEQSWAGVWQYNTPWDIAKAAKDWPQLSFVIYHGGLRAFQELPDRALADFEQTGEIKWASDLARIPAEHGVTNVYAEMGTSFANSCTANPRFAAALLGTWIKGMGVDHVVGAPTRCCTGRRSGRSKRCAGSKSPRTCRRSTR